MKISSRPEVVEIYQFLCDQRRPGSVASYPTPDAEKGKRSPPTALSMIFVDLGRFSELETTRLLEALMTHVKHPASPLKLLTKYLAFYRYIKIWELGMYLQIVLK